VKTYILIFVAFLFIGCSHKEIAHEQTQIALEQEPFPIETKPYKKVYKEKKESLPSEFKNKIAIIFPSKVVSKYASGTINTVLSQMFLNKETFGLEVIDTYDESKQNIDNAINELDAKGYKNILMLVTNTGLYHLENNSKINQMKIYVPLIHKKNSTSSLSNVVYGGIDYEEQIDTLFKYSNGKNSLFSTQTPLGNRLQKMILQKSPNIHLDTNIDLDKNNYKSIVSNRRLNDSTLFINTSIIKTSILLSQLRAYETKPYVILSTQLNYTPLIISLTQYLDRKNFLIANSIEAANLEIEEITSLLDADIIYNWVNYSTLIGINYLLKNKSFEFNPIVKNQVQYRTTVYKNGPYGFRKHTN